MRVSAMSDGFRAQRVGFAVEFLRQEIELAAHRIAGRQQRTRLLHMGGQPVELLAHIGAQREQRDLLRQPVLRNFAGVQNLLQLRSELVAQRGRLTRRERCGLGRQPFDLVHLRAEHRRQFRAFGLARARQRIERGGQRFEDGRVAPGALRRVDRQQPRPER